MFGTMLQATPIPGKEWALRSFLLTEVPDRFTAIDGIVAQYLLEPSIPGETWVGFIVFESESTYRQNAADPEQHQWYLRLRQLLAADPVWHDGQISLIEPSSVSI